MTQGTWTALDPAVDNGVTLSTKLNAIIPALASTQSGTVAPPSPVSGELWFDTSGGTNWLLKVYDGAAWQTLGTLNRTTGQFTATGGITPGQYVQRIGDTMTGALDIAATVTTPALKVTQLGTGHALLIEDSASPDATPVAIDNSGRLLVGTTTNVSSSTGVQVAQIGNNVTSPVIDFTKERAGTPVLNNQVLGITRYWGYDGASYLQAGSIELSVAGTPSTGLMPTALSFRTRSETAAAETTRVTISPNGAVAIGNFSGDGSALATTNPAKLRLGVGQYTDNSTAASGTVNFGTLTSIVGATVNALNTGVTYTSLATVYINAAPAAGTNVTIANPYALYVAAGVSLFGGQVQGAAGTAAAPSFSKAGDTNTGMYFPAAEEIAFASNGVEAARITSAGIRDSKGDVRAIPQNAVGGEYTLVKADVGKHVATQHAIIIPPNVFAVGDAITIFANNAQIQINPGAGVHLQLAGDAAKSGSRTLKSMGLVTVLCVVSNWFVISGAGLE